MQYFSPKSDFVFKQIFGDPNNTDILADFLKAILDIPADDYEKIDLVDTHLNKKYFADKIGILDLKITTKSGHIVDVEIQKSNLADIDKRIAFYLSRLIVDQIGDSDPYTKIKRSIVIFIADYELIKNSPEYHKVWRLRDENGRDFSNVMELNTIELPKLPEKNDHNSLWAWLKFLNSKSQEDFKSVSNENEKIAKAVNTLRNISMNDEARTAYRAEQKSKMDNMAREISASETKLITSSILLLSSPSLSPFSIPSLIPSLSPSSLPFFIPSLIPSLIPFLIPFFIPASSIYFSLAMLSILLFCSAR